MYADAVVIGGGPAGLSSAIGLARAGLNVHLFEQRPAWRRRVCGAFLSPEAAQQMDWLGILKKAYAQGAVPCASLSLQQGANLIPNFPLADPPFDSFYLPLAMERKTLEELLAQKAKESGVHLHLGVKAAELYRQSEGGWLIDFSSTMVHARVVVLADGRHSTFRQKINNAHTHTQESVKAKKGWLGFNGEFKGLDREPGKLSLYIFFQAYVGLLSFGNGLTNVSGLIHSSLKDHFKTDWEQTVRHLLKADLALLGELSSAQQVGAWIGVGALPFGGHMQERSSIFQVGDSAGVFDPFMGEGIGRSLASGELLYRLFNNKEISQKSLVRIHQKYVRVWKREYKTRKIMGKTLRFALGRNWPIAKLLRFITSRAPLRRLLLKSAHHSRDLGTGVVTHGLLDG